MAVQISEFRVAFLQVESFDGLIPAAAPFGFMANPATYEASFAQAQKGLGLWELPRHSGHFWQYYLQARKLEEAKPKDIRSKLLPAFFPSVAKASVNPGIPARVVCSGYGWPHAMGVVASLTVKGAFTLKQAVAHALALRYDAVYQLPGPAAAPVQLVDLLDEAMNRLRGTLRGAGANAGNPGQLFSVVTFINGSGVNAATELKLNSQVHKALEGLAGWNRLWDTAKHKTLGNAITPIKNEEIAGHQVFRASRGRSVWLPGYFGMSDLRVAGCYHSNLTLLSLQIESLATLAEFTAAKLTANQPISQSLSEYARGAAINLSLLYGANKSTYRSASASHQIAENGYIPAINQLRKHFKINGPDLV